MNLTRVIRFFLIAGSLYLIACKNYLGNPHPVAMPSRTVPTTPGDWRIEPANWWTGMRHRQVEVLVHHAGIGACSVHLGAAEGVRLLKAETADSPNYLFLSLDISPEAPPQTVPLVFTDPKDGRILTKEFPIYRRNTAPKGQGLSSRDVIYLLYPDRFADGDTLNDRIAGMADGPDRHSPDGRHGGDLKGILDHLDYIRDLGMTALWLNPELENDQKRTSYHGYAITDLYRVDRRLGTNAQYRELVNQCHSRGIKVVRDAVPNHIGNGHYWLADLPQQDWINQWPEMTYTTHRVATQVDPYASDYDRRHYSNGWFASAMPDLNQRNPHVAAYLIQQALWWVEYSGLDAFRIDTYAYSDQEFMSRFCREIRDEYPAIFLFGEIWDERSTILPGFFADNQPMPRARFRSYLPGIIDFPLCAAIREALNTDQEWTRGISRVYLSLSEDYFYEDPLRNVIMLDNHDMTRFFSAVGENQDKFKTGIAFLLTTRGIPQIYYGTEIGMAGLKEKSDGELRKDFPGGWPGDTADKFLPSGRTPQENDIYNFLRKLLRYRNATPALQTGKLMQFVPENGIYTYFRFDDSKTIMVVLNTSGERKTLPTARFAERMTGFTRGINVLTDAVLTDLTKLELPAYSASVLELQP